MDKTALLIEIWGNASDSKRNYFIMTSPHRPGGEGTPIVGYDIVVLREHSHREVPVDKWLHRKETIGPRMEVTFDVILKAYGTDYATALDGAWKQTVEWMKPKVRADSKIMTLIREGEKE